MFASPSAQGVVGRTRDRSLPRRRSGRERMWSEELARPRTRRGVRVGRGRIMLALTIGPPGGKPSSRPSPVQIICLPGPVTRPTFSPTICEHLAKGPGELVRPPLRVAVPSPHQVSIPSDTSTAISSRDARRARERAGVHPRRAGRRGQRAEHHEAAHPTRVDPMSALRADP